MRNNMAVRMIVALISVALLVSSPCAWARKWIDKHNKISDRQKQIDFAKKALTDESNYIIKNNKHRASYGYLYPYEFPRSDQGIWLFVLAGDLARADNCESAEKWISDSIRGFKGNDGASANFLAGYFSSLIYVFTETRLYTSTEHLEDVPCVFSGKLVSEDDLVWLASVYPPNAKYIKNVPWLSPNSSAKIRKIEKLHDAATDISYKVVGNSPDPFQRYAAESEVWLSSSRVANKNGLHLTGSFFEAAAQAENKSSSRLSQQLQSDKFWSDITHIAGMVLQQMPGNKSTASQLITGMMVNGEDSVGGQQVLDAILEQAISGGAAGKGKRNTSGKCVDVDSGTARVLPDRYCEGTK